MTWKLLRHSRFTYDVFTQKNALSWSYGDNAGLDESANIRCIFSERAELRDWAKEAWRFFLSHREDYDLVMTRSMPPECHWVGLRIKRAFPDIRWVASFGDPIAENPYEILAGGLFSPYSLRNPLRRNAALRNRLSPLRILQNGLWLLRHRKLAAREKELARWEQHTLQQADRLIFNNRSELHYIAKSAEALRKSCLVRHSFDPALFPPPDRKNGRRKLRFVFLGQLSVVRSAMPLLKAIERLKCELDALSERAEFVFFGELTDAELAFILRRELADLVFVKKPIAYRDSLREAVNADWLIHIDANLLPVCGENVFFAGKIADYFGAGKPILAITMAEGDATDCLRRAGAMLLSFSVNEIKQALYQIIVRGKSVSMDRAYLDGFSAGRAAADFDERVVKELL